MTHRFALLFCNGAHRHRGCSACTAFGGKRTEKAVWTSLREISIPLIFVRFKLKLVGFLVFVLVEEEIFLTWIVRPNVFDAFIHFAFIFHFLKVFDNFERSTRTHGVVDKFFSGCWPGRIFKL